MPYATPTAIPCFPEKNTVDVCVSFFDWYQAIEDYTVMGVVPGRMMSEAMAVGVIQGSTVTIMRTPESFSSGRL